MKLLVQSGFVKAKKRGRWVYYELIPGVFTEIAGYLSRFVSPSSPVAGAL
jgi:hypothetical protein